MAQLLVRGLSDDTVRLLRERAKAHGRSVEAEHRAILEEAVGETATSSDLTAALQSLPWLADLDAAELRGHRFQFRRCQFEPGEMGHPADLLGGQGFCGATHDQVGIWNGSRFCGRCTLPERMQDTQTRLVTTEPPCWH